MSNLFDVYHYCGCPVIPDSSDLSEAIPPWADPQWCARLLTQEPGFLGLDLSHESARALLERLKHTDWITVGMIVLARYHDEQSWISIQAAGSFPEKALAEGIRRYPHVKFEPTQFRYAAVLWYTFLASSEELQRRGVVPGALFANVDKLDGHIWRDEEAERLFLEESL